MMYIASHYAVIIKNTALFHISFDMKTSEYRSLELIETELSSSDGNTLNNANHHSEIYDEAQLLTQQQHESFLQAPKFLWLLGLSILSILNIILLTIQMMPWDQQLQDDSIAQTSTSGYRATSIAFGSCTSYDLRDMTIWSKSIIPSDPHVWIWTGDMVYIDDNEINCSIFQNTVSWQQSCNCTPSFIESPPYTCHAGDVDYANRRWMQALSNEPYNQFLDFMCPQSSALGSFPPRGADPQYCDRAILGIYDDHDFGWNNGNGREPSKREFKNMYLDAIGESPESVRRGSERGAWFQYSLNANEGDDKSFLVDVFLLDERYERSPLPCETRRSFCEQVLSKGLASYSYSQIVWCKDFLLGGSLGRGSCCDKDEKIFFGWCALNSSKASEYYRDACDVTYEHFGMRALVLSKDGSTLSVPTGHELVDVQQESSFCEVLGKTQRRWLRRAVKQSTAPLKLFVSSSVLLHNPSPYDCGVTGESGSNSANNSVTCTCGGDNMDCYRTAQLELLHLLSSNSVGCAVVLTGDFHFGDIKVLLPGSHTKYARLYNSTANSKPIYQVMASGMSESTAKPASCESYRLDPLQLRTHPECDFVTGPNFGRVLLDTGKDDEYGQRGESYEDLSKIVSTRQVKKVRLQILSGSEPNKTLLETVFDAQTCLQTTS